MLDPRLNLVLVDQRASEFVRAASCARVEPEDGSKRACGRRPIGARRRAAGLIRRPASSLRPWAMTRGQL
jgi:hypothetical protein